MMSPNSVDTVGVLADSLSGTHSWPWLKQSPCFGPWRSRAVAMPPRDRKRKALELAPGQGDGSLQTGSRPNLATERVAQSGRSATALVIGPLCHYTIGPLCHYEKAPAGTLLLRNVIFEVRKKPLRACYCSEMLCFRYEKGPAGTSLLRNAIFEVRNSPCGHVTAQKCYV